eukprot:2372642-Rhodomonas_salina.3
MIPAGETDCRELVLVGDGDEVEHHPRKRAGQHTANRSRQIPLIDSEPVGRETCSHLFSAPENLEMQSAVWSCAPSRMHMSVKTMRLTRQPIQMHALAL